MARALRFSVAALLPAALLFASSSARADDLFVSGGLGLIGGISGNFLDKPGDKTIPNSGGAQDTSYPGFGGGPNGTFGVAIDVRFLKAVGIELDFIRHFAERGHGDVTLTYGNQSGTTTVDIGQTAWHIPLLFKGVLPLPTAAPFIFVGPEFVMPDTPTATASLSSGNMFANNTFQAQASKYTMITAGFGVEFKLPIPVVDVRIPLEFRGSAYPGEPNNDAGRVTYAGSTTTFNSQWKYLAMVSAGFQFWY